MNDFYTPKQREFLRLWQKNKLKRINLLEGSVRSGKTWISLVLWGLYVASSPKDKAYLMVAKTLTSLKRNCLDLLQELYGTNNFTYSISQKEGKLFGRKIYLEGVNDKRSESKIRGMTLQAAYCDELTLFNEEFFAMLLSRLSEDSAKLIATTNPDTPKHWLNEKYIKRKEKLDMLVMKFLIDDNTKLEKTYVENLKKEYEGVFYERFILGKWKAAQGAIYKKFADNPKKFFISKDKLPNHFWSINIGVDFGGNKSQHAFVCTASSEDTLYVLKSESIDANGVDVDTLIDRFCIFAKDIVESYGRIDGVYCDSAEQTIKNSIMSKTEYSIYNSIKNPIIDRIRKTQYLMACGKFYMVEGENDALCDGLENALWSDKNLTKDERLDDGTSNIDILDAFEYSFEYDYL